MTDEEKLKLFFKNNNHLLIKILLQSIFKHEGIESVRQYIRDFNEMTETHIEGLDFYLQLQLIDEYLQNLKKAKERANILHRGLSIKSDYKKLKEYLIKRRETKCEEEKFRL